MAKKQKHDIDNDPMFDNSKKAISNALDRPLIAFLDRIDRLEEEKKGIADDIRDVYSEANSQGYDSKIMRKIRALRAMPSDARQELDALMETYRRASGIDA